MADAANPEGNAKESKAQRWKCEACAADQRYDAKTQKLICDFCGAVRDVPRGEGAVVEHDLASAWSQVDSMPQGLGVEDDRVSKCSECGAQVHYSGDRTSTRCAFCGAASVLVQEANRRLLRPESLVPFAVDKKRAHDEFAGWLSSLWFRPSDLRKMASVQDLGGVYVPFWTYDAHVDSAWTAEAGYYYYETEEYTEVENGESVTKTREVQRTRWEPAWGQRGDDYDDVLVCGSLGLPRDLAASLRSFDTSQLVPYSPAFLAGWQAEEYAVDLQAGFGEAREEMDREQQRRCGNDVPGDTQRGLSVNSTYSALTFKHVLLPIWIAAYRYRGDVYRFLVNGQTGEVQGKAPYSWLKIASLVLFLAALVFAIYWYASHHR